MRVSDLFVARTRAPEPPSPQLLAGQPPPPPAVSAQGAFITPQSFVTFPVASGLVTLAWALMRQLFTWGSSTMVPAVTALLIGAAIFLVSVSDPDARPKAPAGWLVAVLVGLANTMMLLAAALGISPQP